MLATFIISFREFLEVFLIIGVFLGISKKLNLKREKEIVFASAIGIILSLALGLITFFSSARAGNILTQKNAELLGGYLMIFSGFFIAYVVFSLHNFFVLKRSKAILAAHQKLQQNVFDLSLFSTIVFFIIREGFEIALFSATTSLFSKFIENIAGLMLGLFVSSILGALTFITYIKFSIGRVYKITEYLIILLGASLVKNGVSQLAESHLHVDLANILPLKLSFLPSTSSFLGHFINSMLGLEPNFSLVKLGVISGYILLIYFLKNRKNLVEMGRVERPSKKLP